MADICVTVPLKFGLQRWIDEGDAAGDPPSGEEWHFTIGSQCPDIRPGDRVYVFYNGKLRGYAPLVRVDRTTSGFALVRAGGAVAVTLPWSVRGFRGWRYRWWARSDEMPFPDWRQP